MNKDMRLVAIIGVVAVVGWLAMRRYEYNQSFAGARDQFARDAGITSWYSM